MASQKKPRKRVRFVYQRSSLVTKCIVLATLVVTTIALLALTISIRNHRNLEEEARQEAAEWEHKNAEIEKNIQGHGSVEGDKEVAEKELDMLDKDAIVIIPSASSTP